MKTLKAVLLVVLIVAIGAVVVRIVIDRQRRNAEAVALRAAQQRAAREAELKQLAQQSPQSQPAPEPAVVPQPPLDKPVSSQEPVPAVKAATTNTPAPIAATTPAPGGGQEVRQDPMARVALGLVGVDPDAEAYWLEAIYDTSLSDKEREDLMEDLNEVGLINPKQPVPEDFPLIARRLTLLEELIPSVSDPFMLEHIGEAYKDLLNLYAGETAR